MNLIVSTNIINKQVNEIINSKMKNDLNSSLAEYHIKHPQQVATFDINKGENVCMTYPYGLV